MRAVLSALSLLLSIAIPGLALAANCTGPQKAEADAALKAIEANDAHREELVGLHAPFGLHGTTGDVSGEDILVQGGYLMAHDHDLRTSIWVAYRLTGTDVDGANGAPRIECFRRDPRFARGEGSSTTDYREPIYDRGHLANDADLKDDLVHQLNSYVMSNMSPQHCRFNRGIWLSLEHLVRVWARSYGEIHVTTGAIFDRDGVVGRDADTDAERMLSNNGKQRIGVPSHFYKIIVRAESDGLRAIAFLLEHNNESNGVDWDVIRPVVEGAVSSLAAVERAAGLDLHPDLDRSSLSEDPSDWDFGEGLSNLEATCT